MRKFIAFLSVIFAVSLVSCGDKKGGDTEIPEEPAEAVTEAYIPSQTEENPTEATERSASEQGTSQQSATEPASLGMPTSPDGDILHFPDGGAEFEQQLDESVLAAAQMMFDKACETEWSFTVGSPYPLDFSQYVENEFNWRFYLITADGINSLDDVRADFHKIFSESYEDSIDEVFTEQNGHAYCLNGERGSNFFYEKSEVSEIIGRSEGEIRFKVVNSYSGDGFDDAPYSEEEDFVIVRESGEWRVSKFRLPY